MAQNAATTAATAAFPVVANLGSFLLLQMVRSRTPKKTNARISNIRSVTALVTETSLVFSCFLLRWWRLLSDRAALALNDIVDLFGYLQRRSRRGAYCPAVGGCATVHSANRGDDDMTEMRCDGCGLAFEATVLRPAGGLAPQRNVEIVNPDEYGRICRVAKQRGRAPAIFLECPYLRQTIDGAMAARRL